MKPDHRAKRDLENLISTVRRDLRARRQLTGWIRFVVVALLLAVAATALLYFGERHAISSQTIRYGFVVSVLAAVAVWLVPPLLWRPTARQIALYIDECFPEAENRVLSAEELIFDDASQASPVLIEKFMDQWGATSKNLPLNRILDLWLHTKAAAVALLGFAATCAVLLFFASLWFDSFGPSGSRREPSPQSISFTVEPGDVRIRVGESQLIVVRSETDGLEATLQWRKGESAWNENPMAYGNAERIRYHRIENIQVDLEYRVTMADEESPVYRITTWIPPEIERTDVTYDYPDYLNLERKKIPNAQNIHVVEGTRVRLSVRANKVLADARMVMENGEAKDLERTAPYVWNLEWEPQASDRYRIELVDHDGETNEIALWHDLTVDVDAPPKLEVTFPYEDGEVNSLAEVPFVFRATDDFGLSSVGLRYQVAGQEPVDIELVSDRTTPKDVAGAYELALEELGLEVGDFITWSVWARDQRPGRTDWEQSGDVYFLDIRPYFRQFSRSISDGGGGMGGGAGSMGSLLKISQEVIIATWNLRRSAPSLLPDEFRSRRSTIVESKLALSEAVGIRVQKASSRTEREGYEEAMKQIALAVGVLNAADPAGPADRLSEALGFEREAYHVLLKLRPLHTRVQFGSGGGGGGGAQMDVDELDMDRNTNFYEEEHRDSRETQEAANEALQRLKELAARQKAIAEELAKLISEVDLDAEELERRKRILERLKQQQLENLEELDRIRNSRPMKQLRDQSSTGIDKSLEEAREQMNRNLEQMEEAELQAARSSGNRALSKLEEAERELERLAANSIEAQLAALVEDFERMRLRQRAIADQVGEIKTEQAAPGLAKDPKLEEAKAQLARDKNRLGKDIVEFLERTAGVAENANASQPDVMRELGDWLRRTSRRGIVEDIEQGQQLIHFSIWDQAAGHEEKILKKMLRSEEELKKIAAAIVVDELEQMVDALQELEGLRRALERFADARDAAQSPEDSDEKTDRRGTEDATDPSEATGGDAEPSEESDQGDSADDPDSQAAISETSRENGSSTGSAAPEPAPEDSEEDPTSQTGKFGSPGESDSRPSGIPTSEGGPRVAAGGASLVSGDTASVSVDLIPEGEGDPGELAIEYGGFMEKDLDERRAWMASLRRAQELLPEGDPLAAQLDDMSATLSRMGSAGQVRREAPQYELLERLVARPLDELIEDLRHKIAEFEAEDTMRIADEGAIPFRYRKATSDYFEALAESAEGS